MSGLLNRPIAHQPSPQSCIPMTILPVRPMFSSCSLNGAYLSIIVGKELRLKQQYFWTSASLQDIMRRFKNTEKNISEFPDCVFIFAMGLVSSFSDMNCRCRNPAERRTQLLPSTVHRIVMLTEPRCRHTRHSQFQS
jgi:hypothetical protein